MEYIPVSFPSEKDLQEAWELLASQYGPGFTSCLAYYGVRQDKHVLGLTRQALNKLSSTGIPYDRVSLNREEEADT